MFFYKKTEVGFVVRMVFVYYFGSLSEFSSIVVFFYS